MNRYCVYCPGKGHATKKATGVYMVKGTITGHGAGSTEKPKPLSLCDDCPQLLRESKHEVTLKESDQ